ncbi:MAG: T9SS type A sorting domain-containing protein [Bacteroidales bacterium]|nr:T9SS type A sorting domain-containing protein [Bacteroidales bacterium]
MKRFFCLFLLTLSFYFFAFADTHKVLFIGNSYTAVNDLPLVISKLAESAGDTIIYSSNTPGGCSFMQHLSNATTKSLIQQGGWDYVVLQAQSQEPSFPDDQFMNETYPYGRQLAEMVYQYNPTAKVVFYMTWGRKNGDAYNCPFFPPLCTYEGMDSLLYLRYMMMAEDFGGWVSPVGALWHYLRDNNPEIELYSSDESHPSLAGTYAAACSFYAVLFQKNPRSICNDYNLSSSEALKIRLAAEKVVYDSLAKWFVDVPLNINENDIANRFVLFPNPAAHCITISTDRDIVELSVLSIDGKIIKNCDVGELDDRKLNISAFPKGIYLMQIIDNKQNKHIYKFIKQ